MDIATLLEDLRAESEELDATVAELPPADWARLTPAPGWTIAHQIGHLAWTDAVATAAISTPDEFLRQVSSGDILEAVDTGAAEGAAEAPAALLERWRAGRVKLAESLAAVPRGTKIAWFGPPMSAASMATARIMETWAHGQDVADTFGIARKPTTRLRHVAHIGVRVRDYAFTMRGFAPPAEPFRVELTGPSGELWTWGPDRDGSDRGLGLPGDKSESASSGCVSGPRPTAPVAGRCRANLAETEGRPVQSVTGPALGFCLLATRRRHRADVDVTAEGRDADQWLDIIQAFAGPAGPGRYPGQFA